MTAIKSLKNKGQVDYDYKYDILFFKAAERDYVKSIELDNLVLDIDREGFIVGIQILEASKFLCLDKKMLLKIPAWMFETKVDHGKIEVRLLFKMMLRNKIVEKNPIIIQETTEPLPNSELICEVR